MKEENTYELIDQYLSGSLPDGHEFITRLKNEPALLEEVELQRVVVNALVDYRLIALSQEIKSFRPEPAILPFKSKLFFPAIFLITAALVCSLYFGLKKTEKNNTDPTNISSPTGGITKFAPSSEANNQVLQAQKADREYAKPLDLAQKLNITQDHLAPVSNITELADSTPQKLHIVNSGAVAAIADTFQSIKTVNDNAFTRPCDTTTLFAGVNKTLPCEKSANGSLSIEKATGGAGPYAYSIDGGKYFQSEKIFVNLPSGKYNVLIKDKNNCLSVIEKNLELESKICNENNSYVFDPGRETWDIPTDNQKSGKITIYNKYGQVVFYKNFGIMEHLLWNGTSENGEILKPGFYIYTIEHTDGLLKQGSVTLSY